MAKDVTRSENQSVQRPGDLFDAMRADLDRVFDRFERGWPGLGALSSFGLAPALGQAARLPAHMDVRDEGDKLVIEADLPGIEEKDVAVSLADGVLSIKGERRSERDQKDSSYHIAERSFGRFERALRLPDAVDEGKIEAIFDKGVLRIVAPKRPEAMKAERRIEVRKSP